MLSCREVSRLYSEQQERKLSLLESVNLRMHVAVCSACRQFGRQMTVLRTMAQSYARSPDSKQNSEGDKSGPDDPRP
ncbi:MAG: hypothetical protein VR73_14905 [Gammaproteobacteria bacterium BRH_c0]|nr:MAG: hypothetical protein VR73_14905 [Gammaproteobacteria bacterium BRH_c0]